MSARSASAVVAAHLVAMARSGECRDLDEEGVVLAVRARAMVRALALRVLERVLGPGVPVVGSQVLRGVQAAPEVVLRDLLARSAAGLGDRTSRDTATGLTDLLGRQSGAAAAGRWAQCAAVLVAEEDVGARVRGRDGSLVAYEDAPGPGRPGAQRWAAVADAAALVLASHVLDRDLLVAARRWGMEEHVALLDGSLGSGAGAVAARALALARSGRLEAWGPGTGADASYHHGVLGSLVARPGRQAAGVREVTDTGSALRAARDMPVQVASATALAPYDLVLLSGRQEGLLRAVLPLLEGDGIRAGEARRLGRALGLVRSHPGVASLAGRDTTVLRQQEGLVAWVTDAPTGQVRAAAAALVDQTRPLVAAAWARTRRALARGEWACRDGGRERPWRVVPRESRLVVVRTLAQAARLVRGMAAEDRRREVLTATGPTASIEVTGLDGLGGGRPDAPADLERVRRVMGLVTAPTRPAGASGSRRPAEPAPRPAGGARRGPTL